VHKLLQAYGTANYCWTAGNQKRQSGKICIMDSLGHDVSDCIQQKQKFTENKRKWKSAV